jgi:hypothetical protein
MKTTAKTIGAILGILAASFALSNGCNAQNVKADSNGNFHALSKQRETFSDSTTTKTYTDSKGKTYPVYIGAKGSFYVGRISSKTGKYYRQYLKE